MIKRILTALLAYLCVSVASADVIMAPAAVGAGINTTITKPFTVAYGTYNLQAKELWGIDPVGVSGVLTVCTIASAPVLKDRAGNIVNVTWTKNTAFIRAVSTWSTTTTALTLNETYTLTFTTNCYISTGSAAPSNAPVGVTITGS